MVVCQKLAPSASNSPVRIGHVAIHAVTLQQALAAILALVQQKLGGCVFTPNVDHIMRAHRDEAYRAAYNKCSIALADGMPVLWAARALGTPLPQKVSGSTLLAPLLDMAAKQDLSTYFVGGREGAAAKVCTDLRVTYPNLEIRGHSPPTRRIAPLGSVTLASIEADIRQCRPDLVLVSLTAPHQELWAAAAQARIAPAVLVCTGSAVDILAGLVPAAPKLASRVGMEWAWRLTREPGRLWHRYLVDDPPFVGLVARQWFAQWRPAFKPKR